MWTATTGIYAISCLLEPVYRYPDSYSYQCECTLTLSYCHCIILSYCHTVTLSHYHSVTLSQCHTVMPSRCYRHTVIQCHSVIITESHSIAVTLSLPGPALHKAGIDHGDKITDDQFASHCFNIMITFHIVLIKQQLVNLLASKNTANIHELA